MLEAEGYVTFTSQRGFQAAQFSSGDLQDANHIRRSLQAIAAELAVQRMEPEEKVRTVKRLRRLNQVYENALNSGDRRAADRANADFHRLIYDVSASPILERIRSIVYRITPAAIDLAESEMERSEAVRQELITEHEAIIEALESSDPVAARQAAAGHGESITRRIVSRLQAADAAKS